MLSLSQSLLIGACLLFLLPKRKGYLYPEKRVFKINGVEFSLNRLSPLGLFIETKSDLTFHWESGQNLPINEFNPGKIEEIEIENGRFTAFVPGRAISIEEAKQIATDISILLGLLKKHQSEKYADDETPLPTESQTRVPNLLQS